jgi:NAD(P)-dependent dehydrogenase (short-subunit alcohol dehydrogenase family)
VSFDLELTGRRALVTAGTKGVGAAVVDVLHDAGATVVATARAIPADAHTGVHYIAADMTTAAGCATVAQGLLFRIVASLRNHHTTIRMADKNRRAVLSRERPLRGGHVVGERGQRIVDRGDPKAFCL